MDCLCSTPILLLLLVEELVMTVHLFIHLFVVLVYDVGKRLLFRQTASVIMVPFGYKIMAPQKFFLEGTEEALN